MVESKARSMAKFGQQAEADVFRTNSQRLREDFTIFDSDNTSTVGPLEIDSGVTLTVHGNYVVL